MALNLTVSTSGTGSGIVTSTFPLGLGISCPAACIANLPGIPGDFFSLTATPDPGSIFVKWTATSAPTINQIVPKNSTSAEEDFIYNNVDSDYFVNAEFALCEPIVITPIGPFEYEVDAPFVPVTLIPSGGVGPYSFDIDSASECPPHQYCSGATLPPGLTIGASTGIISGTPTAEAPCQYIPIIVTDSRGCFTTTCIEMVVRPAPICYLLLGCDGRPNPIIVTNDLSQYVGQFINILGECFEVQLSQTCTGSVTLNNPVITAFADCCSCNPPKVYELVDCTLQTLAIITTTPLGSYVGQTVKVCEFISSPVIQIDGIPINCGINELGFVTNITGPTSGSYYDGISNSIKPYTNPLNFPLSVGDQLCVNPISPFDVISHTGGTYLVQFFIGTGSITNQITVNSAMPISTLQWFIDNQITATNTTIVVNTFDTFNHLNVTITTTNPLTETDVTIIVTFPGTVYPPTATVTDIMLGQCTCYTVNDIGTSCASYPPFKGVISGVFPDCVCCDPPLLPEPPPYEPTIPEIDKKTYFIRESQCDIDANKTFANAMYDIFKTEAYGMESCCPRNFNQIWIQKELSDLSKINC